MTQSRDILKRISQTQSFQLILISHMVKIVEEYTLQILPEYFMCYAKTVFLNIGWEICTILWKYLKDSKNIGKWLKEEDVAIMI